MNGILLPKLFWPTVRKNCSSDQEKLLDSRLKAKNLQKKIWAFYLEPFIQTVKWQCVQFLKQDAFNLFMLRSNMYIRTIQIQIGKE